MRNVFFGRRLEVVVTATCWLVYVDDILILSPGKEELRNVVGNLQKLYELRVCVEISKFLGVECKSCLKMMVN